jgi:hypothetical protein
MILFIEIKMRIIILNDSVSLFIRHKLFYTFTSCVMCIIHIKKKIKLIINDPINATAVTPPKINAQL